MYITQEIADRIKSQAKSKKIAVKELLLGCDLNINAVSEFAKGKQLSCISLARMADYLDCSVDYLLGRTSTNVTVSDVHDSVGVVGQANAPVTIHSGLNRQLTTQEKDLLRIYNNATSRQQLRLMDFALTIEEEGK